MTGVKTYVNFLYRAIEATEPDSTTLADAGFVLEEGAYLPAVGDVVVLEVAAHPGDVKKYRVERRNLAYHTQDIGEERGVTSQTIWLTVAEVW